MSKPTPLFCWGRVLERYVSDDMEGASSALTEARKANPHVEPYLTGKKPRRLLPEYYSRGDEDEAIGCMINLGAARERHPPHGLFASDHIALQLLRVQ